jgi:hypothetical protein
MYLAIGCGNSYLNIYFYDGTKYMLRQSLKDSYYKNGARIHFSEDSQHLFTIQSPKQINYYRLGPTLFTLAQQIPVSLEAITHFSLSPNANYFSVV